MVLQGEDVREACHCDVLGETKNTGTSISGGNVRWQHRDLRDYFTANVRFPLPPPSARGRRKKRVGWRDKGITARHCDMALWRHVMKQKRPMFQSGPRGFTTLTVWGDGGGDGGGGGGGQGVLPNLQTGKKGPSIGLRNDGCPTWPYVVILPLAVGVRCAHAGTGLLRGRQGGRKGCEAWPENKERETE